MGEQRGPEPDEARKPGQPEFIGIAIGLPLVPIGPACGPEGCPEPEVDPDAKTDGGEAADGDQSVESGA